MVLHFDTLEYFSVYQFTKQKVKIVMKKTVGGEHNLYNSQYC